MRTPLTGYLLTALAVAVAIFLIGCSWDILTRGEVLKDDDSTLEDLRTEEIEISTEIDPPDTLPIVAQDPPELEILRDTPDTIAFSLTRLVTIDNQERYLIEMEVGELLQGQGDDPDTVLVDHRP